MNLRPSRPMRPHLRHNVNPHLLHGMNPRLPIGINLTLPHGAIPPGPGLQPGPAHHRVIQVTVEASAEAYAVMGSFSRPMKSAI